MRKVLFAMLFLVFPLFFFCAALHSQTGITNVKVRVILVDKELNQKPVPHLTVVLASDSINPDSSREVKTDFEGHAEFQAPPGKYRMNTPQGVDFQGHHYIWEIEINVSGETVTVDLSNDNARVTDLPSVEPVHKVDDLTLMFQKYQK